MELSNIMCCTALQPSTILCASRFPTFVHKTLHTHAHRERSREGEGDRGEGEGEGGGGGRGGLDRGSSHK